MNSEKVYLRVRPREENTSDHENDGSNSNFADIRLKVADITRLEIGREKSSRKSSSSPRPVKSFSIAMRKNVGETNVFNFEAETVAERDSIIAGIKSLLEISKIASDSHRRRMSKSPQVDDGRVRRSRSSMRSAGKKENESAASSIPSDDTAGSGGLYFDFDVPNDNTEPTMEVEESRGDESPSRTAEDDSDRASDSDSGSKKRAKDSKSLAITVIDNSGYREGAIEVAGSSWGIDDVLCGMAIGSTMQGTNEIAKSESSTNAAEGTLRDMNGNAIMYGNAGCNPLSSCNVQALAAVEDVELTAMANEVSTGPFCTDEICTASLKDFTDTMKGIFEMKQNSREGKPDSEKQRVMAEDYITGVLGAPSTMANLLSVTDMWNPTSKPPAQIKKKTLQNRSRSFGGQAARLSRLRKQMTFSTLDTSEKMPFVQIVSSYDDVERSGRFGPKLTSVDIAKPPRTDSSQFLRNVVKHMNNGAFDSEEDILYYDSDPEDTRERTTKRGPRRALADRDNLSPRGKPRTEALCDIPMSRISLSRRLRRADDDIVHDIIDTMKNEKITLIWHPAQTKENPNRAPFCAKVWIESGMYLIDGTFLLPKLTWVPVFEGCIQSKVLNVTLSNPGTIDLLDVCRVRECDKIDRRVYPFAKVDCSFIIQTQKGSQVFETQSRQERSRVVNGLRLVIARLASLLMLRDLRAVDEFFGGNSVPGEAPTWAQGKNEKNPGNAPSLP